MYHNFINLFNIIILPVIVAQSVASASADPVVANLIPACPTLRLIMKYYLRSFSFFADMCTICVLDNRLGKLAQEIVWLGELTIST